jgi:hypothetical protein
MHKILRYVRDMHKICRYALVMQYRGHVPSSVMAVPKVLSAWSSSEHCMIPYDGFLKCEGVPPNHPF